MTTLKISTSTTDTPPAPLRECPNPECGRDGINTACRKRHIGREPERHSVACTWCELSGPVALSEGAAIALWNALPREEPWIAVTERMPVLNQLVEIWDDDNHHWLATIEQVSSTGFARAYPLHVDNFGAQWLDALRSAHWRPHTPPRGPR